MFPDHDFSIFILSEHRLLNIAVAHHTKIFIFLDFKIKIIKAKLYEKSYGYGL